VIRECLRVGLAHDLVDGPATRHALALLRRAALLAELDRSVAA